MSLHVDLTEFERYAAFFQRAGAEYVETLAAAGRESADEILDTRGLRAYPPATAANMPGRVRVVTFSGGRTVTFRRGYYIRGRGMMRPVRGGGYELEATSQNYGKSWVVETNGYQTRIGTKVTYARWLTGDEQAAAMGAIGWRKIAEVANEKLGRVTDIFRAWLRRLISRHNLD